MDYGDAFLLDESCGARACMMHWSEVEMRVTQELEIWGGVFKWQEIPGLHTLSTRMVKCQPATLFRRL